MAPKQKTSSERDGFEKPNSRIDYETKSRMLDLVRYLILGVTLLYILFPLYLLIISGFKPTSDIFSMDPSIIPSTITIDNFFVLFDETDFGQYLLNSVIVAIGTSTLTVCLALLGGYGLARSEFRGQRNLARGILFTYMFPYILIGLPLYYMFYRIGLLNTYLGLVLAQTAIALPFSMWLMWQFFQTIPLSFEESAWICGASKLRTFVEIVLPMSLPGMIAISIFSFAVSWSDFTFAVIVMTENAMKTFPVGLFEMMSQDNVHWGMLTAAGTIIMIPAFVLVYFLQRYILIGFTIGE